MNEEQHFIEYLESIQAPEAQSPHHRESLRRELIQEMARRRAMQPRKRLLKVIYALIALICLSALAYAAHQWFSRPKEIYSETMDLSPTQSVGVGVFRTGTSDLSEKDQQEIDQLTAEGKRELVEVVEKQLDNGETIKVYRYKYVLSDGREMVLGSSDNRSLEDIKAQVHQEIQQKKIEFEEKARRAREQGKREIAQIAEVRIGDQTFTTYSVVYKMPDGSEVPIGEGDNMEQQLRAAVGDAEFEQLTQKLSEKQGEPLEPEDRQIEGQTFHFTRTRIVLSDGRELVYSDGRPLEN